ncbi:MAG: tetratricopeptide repeat protein [Sandaracinaceae bacterium]|nr:tetratricopeptide repeat protein [Sandaracinaceae bacterium]
MPDDAAQAARARELFAEGVEHAASQRWARAIDAFEQALELHSAPAILYNLAAALVESGRYRDAHGHLLALEADPTTAENLATLARELRVRIEAEAGRLRVTLDPAIADAEVVLDTMPVPPEVLATAIPVRPGEHRVVATRGAEMITSATVTATAGTVSDVTLQAPLLAVDPETPSTSTPIVEEPAFWIAIGGGVLLIAGVVILTAVLLSEPGQEVVPGDFTPGLVTWP